MLWAKRDASAAKYFFREGETSDNKLRRDKYFNNVIGQDHNAMRRTVASDAF
jgi:transposase-like protein